MGHGFFSVMAEAQESQQKHARFVQATLRIGPLAHLHTCHWLKQVKDRVVYSALNETVAKVWKKGRPRNWC